MLLSSTRFLLMAALMAVMAGCSIAPTQAPQPPVDDRPVPALEPTPPPAAEPEPSEPAVAHATARARDPALNQRHLRRSLLPERKAGKNPRFWPY